MYFTATKTETITQVRTTSGTTAAVGATLCQIGVYEEANDGSLTLIASTANDTALWSGASTAYTKSFSASFSKVAGTRYALATLVVGASTPPTMQGHLVTTDRDFSPRFCALASSSTLSSPISAGSLSVSSSMIYGALLP
jgi:hypothetical protein